jgi:hypothetical protein
MTSAFDRADRISEASHRRGEHRSRRFAEAGSGARRAGVLLAHHRFMATRKIPSRSEPSRTGSTPPSVSDEELARSDEGKLFTDDGRKAHDTERVGAVAPDTDPDSDITAPMHRPQAPYRR